MSSRPRSPSPDVDTVQLLVRRAATIDLRRAASELRNLEWLGVPDANSAGLTRVITTELELPVLDGSSRGSPIRKSVIMEIGRPQVGEDVVAVDISWRSATLAPLFPVFVGRLVMTSKGVTLDGRYAPPFGQIGLLIDRGLLHFVARRTGSALLGRLADRISGLGA